MKKHNNNIARTKEDFTLGILKGKTIFPYGYPGNKQMTMNTPAGVVPFPIEYIGVTNGQITDRGVALPGEDFIVNGDTVIEKQINMKNRYNTSLEEDFKAQRQALGNKGLEPMSYGKGGKMPQWLAEARFKAAGEEDKMSDYGYMKGGEVSRLKALKEKLYKKYQEGGEMMEEDMIEEVEEVTPNQVVKPTMKRATKPTAAPSISILDMVMTEMLDKISTGQTFTPKSINKLVDDEMNEEDVMMIVDLFNNAIKMIESKDIDVSDDEALSSFINKLGLTSNPLIKSLYDVVYGTEQEEVMEEVEEEVEEEMPSNKNMTFSQAYAQAKQQGLPEFMWQGSKYKTNLSSQAPVEETEEVENKDMMEEEDMMEGSVSDEELSEIEYRLGKLRELQQKALGGYTSTPYMSQIPTGDELGEYTPFSKYRDNNRNYKSQAGINDFLGKAMFMGQDGLNIENEYRRSMIQPSSYVDKTMNELKRAKPSYNFSSLNNPTLSDTIVYNHDFNKMFNNPESGQNKYDYYRLQHGMPNNVEEQIFKNQKINAYEDAINKYNDIKNKALNITRRYNKQQGGNVPGYFTNSDTIPQGFIKITEDGWNPKGDDMPGPLREVGGYGNDYYRYDEKKKGGYLKRYQTGNPVEPIVPMNELPIGDWQDVYDLQDKMQQFLDYQNNLRINQNEQPLDFNKIPEDPNLRKSWNSILKDLKEGIKTHREHYKNKNQGPSAFDQHMKMMRQCDDYNPPVMKKGGYATPKYRKGQVIQYKQGGKIMTGVIDQYNPKTGQIKLK